LNKVLKYLNFRKIERVSISSCQKSVSDINKTTSSAKKTLSKNSSINSTLKDNSNSRVTSNNTLLQTKDLKTMHE